MGMRYQKSYRSFFTTTVILAAAFGCFRSEAAEDTPAPAEVPNALFELIDAAKYSREDKESLKTGLAVAIASITNESIVTHVSQATIDIQIKKSQTNYVATRDFVFDVAKYIESKSSEFMRGETFQRIPPPDRDVVAAYFGEVVEHYRARALETLFAHYDRTLSVPAHVSPSITNAEYRNLLTLAAMTPAPKYRVHLTPGQKAYVLKKGDSLASVARQHKLSPEAIIAANPGLKPTQMRPGQVLVIPSSAGVTTTVPALTKETALTSTR